MDTLEFVLGKTFSFLGREWVRQFLLESTAAEDLGLLTAQEKLRHAVNGTIRMVGEGTGFAHPNLFSAQNGVHVTDVHSDWIIIPALGVEDVSARLMVMRIAGGGMRLIHQVSNDDTGDVLAVFVDRASETCEVMLITPGSTSRRQRNLLHIPLRALRSRDPVAAARSVLFRARADESLSCAQCASRCSCVPPLRTRVRHPLDFATAASNMLTHAGKFEGTLTNTIFLGGQPFSSPPCPIFGGLERGTDANIMSSFLTWAIQRTLTDSLPSAVPTAPYALLPPPASADVSFDPLRSPLPFLDGAEDFFDAAAVEELRDCDPGVALSVLPDLAPLQPADPITVPTVPVSSAAMSNVTIPSIAAASLRAAPPAPQMATRGGVPAFSFVSPASNESGVQVVGSADEPDEKELKAFRRKLRNRESAARCNKRNQQIRKEMKKSLGDEKEKLKLLQARLKKLQEENKTLHSALGSDAPAAS